MSFFYSSSGIIINGGHFTSNSLPTPVAASAGGTQVLGDIKNRDSSVSAYAQADELWKRRRCKRLDGLMIVKADEVDLHRELIRGIGYRIHSASHHGRLVAVKAFEGPRAKQDWTVDVAFSKEFLHSNVLKIEGISDESSKSHFVLFRGITSEQTMQSLIAKALRTDLNISVQISMKAVKGIAAGLSYIESQNIPVYPGPGTNNIQNWENFNIFTGYDNEPIISFHPSTVHESGSISHTFYDEINGRGIEVLSGLCQQLFSGANSILYDDSPERVFDVYDSEGSPRAPMDDTEDNPSVSHSEDSNMSNPSNSSKKPKSSRTPRREVWWLDLGVKKQSLESIKRRFEDCLDRFLPSSSASLLRHITSPMDKLRHNLHQCPGYLREEITLVSDVSKSVIISHAFPSQSEVCSICGQLVQYKGTEPSIVEAPEDQTQIWEHTANDRPEQHAQLPRLRELLIDPRSSTQTYPSSTSLSTEGARAPPPYFFPTSPESSPGSEYSPVIPTSTPDWNQPVAISGGYVPMQNVGLPTQQQPHQGHSSHTPPNPSQLAYSFTPFVPNDTIRPPRSNGPNDGGPLRTPKYGRQMPNGYGPRSQGGQSGSPPAGLSSSRLASHPYNSQFSTMPPPPPPQMQPQMQPIQPMLYYPHYMQQWYNPMQMPPQHQPPPHQPHPGSQFESQMPHTGLFMSPRNPPSAIQNPSTPTLSHNSIASPVHKQHPHPYGLSHSSNSLGLTSLQVPPTPLTPSISGANLLDVGSRTFVPRAAVKLTIKKADGTEVSLENLTKSAPTPPTSAVPSPQNVVLRQGKFLGTPNRRPTSIRMETQDQYRSRPAEQEKLKAEATDVVLGQGSPRTPNRKPTQTSIRMETQGLPEYGSWPAELEKLKAEAPNVMLSRQLEGILGTPNQRPASSPMETEYNHQQTGQDSFLRFSL